MVSVKQQNGTQYIFENIAIFKKIIATDKSLFSPRLIFFLYRSGHSKLQKMWFTADGYDHRVNREDSTIIILDTTLVPDFVLHASYFFIAVNRPVLMLPHSTNKSLSYENRGPKSLFVFDTGSEIFFLITYEISKLGRLLSED